MKITVIQKLENTALSLEILSGRILLLARQPPSLRASPVEVPVPFLAPAGALSGRLLCSPSAEEDQGPRHAHGVRTEAAKDEI